MTLEITYPFFKPDKVLSASIRLGKFVDSYIKEFDAIMESPASFQRGVQMSELLNKLQGEYVLWWIDTNQQIRAGNVDDLVKEHYDSMQSGSGI
jgi:hypothetical protein